MNNESKAVKEKLDGLMAAAAEFGSQSAQLAKVRESFEENVAKAGQVEQQMRAVVEKCDEYINAVQALLEKDYSAQIDAIVAETGKSVEACKEQCEAVTAQYKEALSLLEQQRPAFEEKTASQLQELSDSVDQVREELGTTVLETVEQSRAELVKVKQESSAMQTDLAAVKTEMEASKAWQIKNEMLIKIGVIAAAIAAVASIVNLFI